MLFYSYSSLVNFGVIIENVRVKTGQPAATIETDIILLNRGVFKLKLDYIYINVRLNGQLLTDPKRPPFVSGREIAGGGEYILPPNGNGSFSTSFPLSKTLQLKGSEKWIFIVWILLDDVPVYGRQMIERRCTPSAVKYL